jgi:hypothetical protein
VGMLIGSGRFLCEQCRGFPKVPGIFLEPPEVPPMKSQLTDIEIGMLLLALLPLIAIIGWQILTSNAVRPVLPRWLQRQLR